MGGVNANWFFLFIYLTALRTLLLSPSFDIPYILLAPRWQLLLPAILDQVSPSGYSLHF